MFYNFAPPMKAKKTAKPHPMPADALVYPRFSGVPTFMRLPHIPRPEELDLALIGIPFDGGTTYRPGARFGPRNVRVQSAMIRPWNPVLKTNPFEKWRIGDFGDLSINPLSIEDTYQRITEQLGDVLRAGARTSPSVVTIPFFCPSFGLFTDTSAQLASSNSMPTAIHGAVTSAVRIPTVRQ